MKPKDWLLVALGIYSIAMTIIQCYHQIPATDSQDDLPVNQPKIIYRKVSLPKSRDLEVTPSTITLPKSLETQYKPNQILGNPISTKDSVASMELNASHLKLTFSDTVGNLSQREFKINLDRYRYVWVNGQLTAARIPKRFKFSPYAGISYRPFNKLTDAEAGIKLKSQHLTYSLSIHGFYYPKFKAEPGWDIKFGIQYEF